MNASGGGLNARRLALGWIDGVLRRRRRFDPAGAAGGAAEVEFDERGAPTPFRRDRFGKAGAVQPQRDQRVQGAEIGRKARRRAGIREVDGGDARRAALRPDAAPGADGDRFAPIQLGAAGKFIADGQEQIEIGGQVRAPRADVRRAEQTVVGIQVVVADVQKRRRRTAGEVVAGETQDGQCAERPQFRRNGAAQRVAGESQFGEAREAPELRGGGAGEPVVVEPQRDQRVEAAQGGGNAPVQLPAPQVQADHARRRPAYRDAGPRFERPSEIPFP